MGALEKALDWADPDKGPPPGGGNGREIVADARSELAQLRQERDDARLIALHLRPESPWHRRLRVVGGDWMFDGVRKLKSDGGLPLLDDATREALRRA